MLGALVQAGFELTNDPVEINDLAAVALNIPMFEQRGLEITKIVDKPRAEIGDLLPNCTIPPGQLEGFVTTAEAISDLPPVAAGEEATHYVGPPVGPYQEMMRAGLTS